MQMNFSDSIFSSAASNPHKSRASNSNCAARASFSDAMFLSFYHVSASASASASTSASTSASVSASTTASGSVLIPWDGFLSAFFRFTVFVFGTLAVFLPIDGRWRGCWPFAGNAESSGILKGFSDFRAERGSYRGRIIMMIVIDGGSAFQEVNLVGEGVCVDVTRLAK